MSLSLPICPDGSFLCGGMFDITWRGDEPHIGGTLLRGCGVRVCPFSLCIMFTTFLNLVSQPWIQLSRTNLVSTPSFDLKRAKIRLVVPPELRTLKSMCDKNFDLADFQIHSRFLRRSWGDVQQELWDLFDIHSALSDRPQIYQNVWDIEATCTKTSEHSLWKWCWKEDTCEHCSRKSSMFLFIAHQRLFMAH